MMKKIERKIDTFDVGDGFFVEIVRDLEDSTGKYDEAWLYHENIGIKESMFGIPQKNGKIDDLIEANLPDAIEAYADEHMDEMTNWINGGGREA